MSKILLKLLIGAIVVALIVIALKYTNGLPTSNNSAAPKKLDKQATISLVI